MTDFMSPEALTAALPEVLAAPRDRGAVRLLCLRPKPNQRSFPGRLTLTRAVGVVGDFEASRPWLVLKDGSPDPRNQVSIMSARVLDLVWHDRDPRNHPGDNIACDLDLSRMMVAPNGRSAWVVPPMTGPAPIQHSACAASIVRLNKMERSASMTSS
jgi:hypothetical protein